MATVTGDVDVRATPAQILDVLADLEQYPEWSAVHRSATVESRFRDRRPKRATMAVAAAGMVDKQTLDYEWTRSGVHWTLVHAGQQRGQEGSYRITSGRGCSHVHYELRIDPSIPVPGFITRRVMHKALTSATEGLRDRVEELVHTPTR